MLFSSAVFLFLFLPIFLVIYFLTPLKLKNLTILIFSLAFYAWGEYQLVLLMILSTLVDYTAGLVISSGRKKIGLAVSIIFNIGILIYFKYVNFFIGSVKSLFASLGVWDGDMTFIEVALPIGISFYTFQTMSYSIDVYRGKVKANKNIIEFATYVTMFPQLVAGPIVRYSDIEHQLRNKNINLDNIYIGSKRFIVGLGKKMLLANSFAVIADHIFESNLSYVSTELAWLGIATYSLQIFFDFSGYSDMAIGLGKILGFDFLENFNLPYTAKSIKEFWRRWHISLSQWFRDYLYISLGGNRKGQMRLYVNLGIVFIITGLWHGAGWTFIAWGMFHGAFLVLERLWWSEILEKLWKPLQHIYTLLIVMIAWVFFRSDGIGYAFEYLKKMFSLDFGNSYMGSINTLMSTETMGLLIIGIILCTNVYRKIYWRLIRLSQSTNHITGIMLKLGHNAIVVWILLMSITYLAAGSYNPFIYFRF